MPEFSPAGPIHAPDQVRKIRAALDALLDMLADEVVKNLRDQQSVTTECAANRETSSKKRPPGG
jgi:hypothetical protein